MAKKGKQEKENILHYKYILWIHSVVFSTHAILKRRRNYSNNNRIHVTTRKIQGTAKHNVEGLDYNL